MKKFFFFILAIFIVSSIYPFKIKHAKSDLDGLVYVDKYLRIVETVEDFRNLTGESFISYEGILKFLQENGSPWYVLVDKRRGVPDLIDGGAIPFLPGPANNLKFEDFGASCNSIQCIPKEKVEEIARNFLSRYEGLFPVKQEDIKIDKDGTIPVGESIYLIRFQWYYNNVPVERGSIYFIINNGNLIQISSKSIAPINLDPNPYFSKDDAFKILQGYLGKNAIGKKDRIINDGSLLIIPVTKEGYNPDIYSGAIGEMASYKLTYRFIFRREGVQGTWEALIDAHSGQILRFVDINRYGKIQGGVYKTDMNPTRVEVTMPFPYADYGSGLYSDIGGNFPGTSGTSTMTGRPGSAGQVGAVDINDNCGAISLSSDAQGMIDFGTSGGTDCTTPGFGGAGNTHSSRTQYYNVAWIKIKGYTYLTGNTWLQGVLTDNVNINDTCNAYWNGSSVNFFRKASSPCRNTGELPGVSLHEWAHGMDDYDGSGGDSPPVETRADWTAIMQTHESCAGGGFFESWDFGCGSNPSGYNCDGYGDCCTACSGIRDADWAKHASNTPWTPANNGQNPPGYSCSAGGYVGPCGWEDHCESGIATQALWDMATRDLETYCGMDETSAWQLIDRLWYSSMPQMGNMYTCTPPNSSGCTGNTLYNLFRAIDDDGDGTANGTPHAQGIYRALARHNIACGNAGDQANQNQTSCPSLSAPTLSGVAGSNSVTLNWNSITGATRYFVFRNDTSCNSGFTKIATVYAPTTTYTDNTPSNGITSYYRVQAATNNDSCVSPMSNCVELTPQPCAGSVQVDAGIYNCSDTVQVTVLDSTVGNPVQVEFWSTTDGTHKTLTLTNSPPGSASYVGTFYTTTSSTPGPNEVRVSDGDTIYIRYTDPDWCGTPNVQVDTTALVDCQPPVISNVQANVSGITVQITWTTDENSDSVLYYGTNPPNWSTASDPSMTTNHSITITNLDTCTKYYFWVQSTDIAGNTGSNDNGGSYYTFVTGLVLNLIDEDFEGSWGPYGNNPPTGWTIEDHGSIPGTWDTNDWYNYTKGGIYGQVARVYYSPVEDQDEWLITPAFDISSDLTSVSLEFDHYFYEWSAEDAYVDITSDQHPTWTTLAHYDSTTANMAHENISLNSYIGNTNVKIRFRYVGNNGWYWEVDNVKVVGSGICATSSGQISLDRNIYHCNNDVIWITIRDTDLSGTAQATVTTTGGDSETVTCYETGVGVFKGSINTGGLPRTVGDGILQVIDSETITATYYDADDGTGTPQVVQDTAITDCKGPVITNVQIINITGTSADVVWTTDEASDSYVQYDTNIPPIQWNASDPNMVTNHIVHLTGLSSCTRYYLFVRSADIYGNATTNNNGGNYYYFDTPGEVQINVTSTDVPKAIYDNSTVTSTITITENRTIVDVNVTITNITHTYDGDLDIYLISPNGTRVELSTDNGLSGDNYINTVFDDEASISILSGTAPFTGSFIPEGSLSVLDGESTQGTWTLEITDDASGDTGTLYGWSITITYAQACGTYLEYQSSTFTDSCSGSGSGVGNGYVDPGEDINLQITLFNSGAQGATGVSATISTTTLGITITDNFATFPNIPAGESRTSQANHFSFKVGTGVACGTEIQFNININSNEGSWSDTFTMTVGHIIPGGTITVFQQNFDSVTVPNLPAGWTTQVISGNPWATYYSYYCSAPNQLNYPFHSTQAANSWAFTPGITLQAGVTYTLNFNERVASYYYPENLEVRAGTAPDASSQTILIWSQTNITNTTCELQSPTFTVPSDGTYYIGFHCTSDPDMWRMVVDDIVLTYQQAPSCTVQPCTPAQPNIVYFSSGSPTPIDEDGDGVMEAGERWQMNVTVTNTGTAGANDVLGSLSGEGIEVCNNPGNFGNIPVSGTGNYTFEFVVDSDFWYGTYPCGSSIGFDLINKSSDSGNYTYADDLNFRTQQVGVPAGSYDLFLDDFPNLNNWTQNPAGSTTLQTGATSCGHSTNYARIDGGGSTFTHSQSTFGYTNIHIIFDVITNGMDANEYLFLEWYDGSTWNTAWSGQPTSWQCGIDVALPAGASNNPNFQIRFRNNASNANERGSVDYVIIRGTTAGNCGTWTAVCPGGVPKPIPDGDGVTTPVVVSKAVSDGSQLTVIWDDQCTTSNVNIIYGPISGLSSYQISGSKCDIANPDTWNIGATTNIWFVLVSDNGSGTESSWGTATGGQRNGINPSGQCGNNLRDNSGTCP